VLQRGAQVVASDGPVGEVTGFVVEGVSGAISSLVVQLGHWLTRHEQAIPIATVERIDSGTLYLTLARDQVTTLPAIPG
ncbi:MAG: PRC-barrel domain-containing protein, partial [Roseiflexaceae bacterium]